MLVLIVSAAASVGGVVIGALASSALDARRARRELEAADTHELLGRVRDLELFQARTEGQAHDIADTLQTAPRNERNYP